MSKLKNTLKSAGALDIVVEYSSLDIICYTNFSDASGQWIITVTNGDCFWRTGLTEKDIKQKVLTVEAIRDSLASGHVTFLTKSDGKGVLTLNCGGSTMELLVTELSAVERKAEIKSFVFKIVKRLTELKKEVTDSKQEIEDMRKKKVHEPLSSESVGKSLKAGQNRIKKPAGHSLINPSTKRRKAAVGVVFGDDEDNS